MTDIPVLPKQLKPSPIFRGMPAWLKDPKNYDKVQEIIIESFAGKHSHGEVVEWAACPDCQRRFMNRADTLQKLGFTSPAQYMAWKQVMHQMRSLKRDKLQ